MGVSGISGVVSWLGWEVHTLVDFAFHSLNLHNVVYMYIMYTYLPTYIQTYLHSAHVRTNVFLDTLWCKCQCNVTLHVGSFTTSKKGVKTLLFFSNVLWTFLNFPRFSLHNFLTNIFTVCHIPFQGFIFTQP